MADCEIEMYVDGFYPEHTDPTPATMIAKYDIYNSAYATAIYNVSRDTFATALYDVVVPASVTAMYNVLPNKMPETFVGGWSKYIIELYDPILKLGQFQNLKIRKRLNQIHTLEFDIINPTEDILSRIVYNSPLRIRVNDRVVFSGFIKRIEKNENYPIYHIFCESAASILRDINITGERTYTRYGSYYIISDLLLPATNWENLTTDWGYIDYKVTPGDALYHIENICKLEGMVWDVRQVTSYREITGISGDVITVSGSTIEDNYYTGRFGAYTTGASADCGFTIVSQTGNNLTISPTPTDAAIGDRVVLWGKYVFYAWQLSTTTATSDHYIINKNAYNLERKQNVDKIITSIIAVGQNPEVARDISFATACTTNYIKLVSDESCLTTPATPAGTTLYLYSTTGYPNNGVVQIDSEKVSYKNKTATSLTGCTRGYGSTTATYHYPNDDVLLVSELQFDSIDTAFPSSGSVWLGVEKIDFTSRSTTGLYGLTRGAGSTKKYRHCAGCYAFDSTYTETSPQSGSPVALYGLQKSVISVVGATLQTTLDKYAQTYMFSNNENVEYGSFSLLSSDTWKDIQLGSLIKFTDKSGVDNYWYIVGVDYKQYKPVKLYFGITEDNILEDISRIKLVEQSAREKNDKPKKGTISELSVDGKCACITYDDGTSEWKMLI